MEYGIAQNSFISVRIAPSHKSELTSQILFGEDFQILETKNDWSYIKTSYDNYEGWINNKENFVIIPEIFLKKLSDTEPFVVNAPIAKIYETTRKSNFLIPGGSILPFFDRSSKSFQLYNSEYVLDEDLDENKTTRDFLTKIALEYSNCPYLWGGKTPFGIDCSGFTQIIYRIAGIRLPRDSSEQVHSGKTISFINEAKPGDLAFFDNEEGKITHVGIILKDQTIIHASGKVRKDMIDHQGIFNKDKDKYTHSLRLIKNIIDY
ncbi:MAG: NlpC/P60 family protein [Bacteroidota bacterium]